MTAALARAMASEAKEPVVQFAVAKSMRYRARLAWVVGLFLAGVALQAAFLSFLPGLPFVVASVVLSWVVGFDNRLDRRGLPRSPTWESVPFEKVVEIVRLDAAMRRWDASAIDLTCPGGFATWTLAAAAVACATLLAGAVVAPAAAAIVAVDGAAVLLQWFSGMRTLERRPDLVLKAEHVAAVVAGARAPIEAGGGKLKAQLQMVGHPDARGPEDVRIVVDLGTPERMLLVQGQVVLNRVQGRPYPYFYAVVVAPRGAGLCAATQKCVEPTELLVETSAEKDVDIVVVRQRTTKTSGYHTPPAVGAAVLATALALAREFDASP